MRNGFLLFLTACAAYAQTAPTLGVDKAAISFSHTIGAAKLPAAQTVNARSTPNGVGFTLAVTGPSPHQGAWLLPAIFAGRAPQAISLQVNPTGLAAGSYTATVTLTATSGSPAPTATVTVTLVVGTPAPSITTSPTSLAFTYITGQPIASNPALSRTFVLSNTGTAIPATLSVTGATWLKVSPTGNITLVGLLNSINATVDPTGLAPKTYNATIKIDSKQAATTTVSIAVSLTVQAAPPVATGTWPAGAIQQSPASVITLAGSDFFSHSTAAVTGFTSAIAVTATDGTNSATETFYIPVYSAASSALRVAMGSPLPGAVVGMGITPINLTAAGGSGTVSWSVIGNLPPGLSLSAGVISGSATSAGSYFFTLQVMDSSTPPKTATMPMKMIVLPSATSATPRITGPNAPIPAGVVGTAMPGGVAIAAIGGASALTYSATAIPAGLTLDATSGAFLGTPTNAGTTGPLTATVVSERAMLVTLPSAMLANAGLLRIAVTTPAPGGGTSNEAQFQIYGPAPQITAVVNSASLAQGRISPGEVVTLFGLGLGPSTMTLFDPSGGTIATSLPGTGPASSITFNGTAAPLLYTSANQLAAIMPYTVTGPNVDAVVSFNGVASQPFTLTFANVNPGLFTTTNDGKGQGAILNFVSASGDYILNSGTNPATKGQTVILYLNGGGTTTATSVTSLTPATPAVTPTGGIGVTIGGQSATVASVVAPPGSVPGLLQLNVTVPANAPTGLAVPVVVTVDGVDSQTGVTMAIK